MTRAASGLALVVLLAAGLGEAGGMLPAAGGMLPAAGAAVQPLPQWLIYGSLAALCPEDFRALYRERFGPAGEAGDTDD